MDEIPGWFDYAPFWERAVQTAPHGSTLVEVGVFCGKSLAHLAKLARAANKGLRVVGVDTFRGSPEHFGGASNLHELPPFALASLCIGYLDAAGVLGDVTLVAADSVKAAPLFADHSVWAVFLDADHSEEAVAADIGAWRWKVALPCRETGGGWLGGHDYHVYPGVKAAVDRLLPYAETRPDRSWWETRKALSKEAVA